jgi:hypothetical protein
LDHRARGVQSLRVIALLVQEGPRDLSAPTRTGGHWLSAGSRVVFAQRLGPVEKNRAALRRIMNPVAGMSDYEPRGDELVRIMDPRHRRPGPLRVGRDVRR